MKINMNKRRIARIILLGAVILVCSFGSAFAAANLEPINAFLIFARIVDTSYFDNSDSDNSDSTVDRGSTNSSIILK